MLARVLGWGGTLRARVVRLVTWRANLIVKCEFGSELIPRIFNGCILGDIARATLDSNAHILARFLW